jgi:hypothetical protein
LPTPANNFAIDSTPDHEEYMPAALASLAGDGADPGPASLLQ